MIYLIILIILLVPVFLYDVAGFNKGMNGWYIFEFTILVLLAGLRYRVGGDTLFYMGFFDEYPQLNELSDFDFAGAEFNPLWYIFNAITKFIHNDFVTFQIIQAINCKQLFFSGFLENTQNIIFSYFNVFFRLLLLFQYGNFTRNICIMLFNAFDSCFK